MRRARFRARIGPVSRATRTTAAVHVAVAEILYFDGVPEPIVRKLDRDLGKLTTLENEQSCVKNGAHLNRARSNFARAGSAYVVYGREDDRYTAPAADEGIILRSQLSSQIACR